MQPLDSVTFLQTVTDGGLSATDGGIIGVLLGGLFVVWRRYQDVLNSRHADAMTAIRALNEVSSVLKDMATQASMMSKTIEKLEERVEVLTQQLREARQ